MKSNFIEAGKIVGVHGINGEMKVENWTDSPQWLKGFKKLYFENGKKDVDLISSRVHKNGLLIKIENVNTPEEARNYFGKVIFIDKKDAKLPKNRYFISDLIGLKVYDGESKKYYGEVKDVIITGANNVYKIVDGDKEYLFPAVDHMIKRTDLEEGVIEVLPIDGIFNLEDEVNEN